MNRPASDILDDALELDDEDPRRWDLVTELHRRHDADTFGAARRLLNSDLSRRRVLAIDVLAQLGASLDVPREQRRHRGETVELLRERMGNERDADVLAAMGTACGHLQHERLVEPLSKLRAHPDDDVRFAVVSGLCGLDSDQAVRTLIELTRDRSSDVRDWSTFGLGTQIERDDREIRDALAARLDDEDLDTRQEALVGLAKRGDTRALPYLHAEIAREDPGGDPLRIETATLLLAAKVRDPVLCSEVARLAEEWPAINPGEPMPGDLQAAVAKCADRGDAG